MNTFKKLLGIKERTFDLRYSKSHNHWEVIKDTRIVYMGSKEGCELFIRNMEVFS